MIYSSPYETYKRALANCTNIEKVKVIYNIYLYDQNAQVFYFI